MSAIRATSSGGGTDVAVGVGVAVGSRVAVGFGVAVGSGAAVGAGAGVAVLLHATAISSAAPSARPLLKLHLPAPRYFIWNNSYYCGVINGSPNLSGMGKPVQALASLPPTSR